MKRRYAFALTALLVLLAPAAPASGLISAARPQYSTVTAAGPTAVHVVSIPATASVDIQAVTAVAGTDGITLERTSQACVRVRCLFGVNADMFHSNGQPVGGVMVNRQPTRPPVPGHQQLNLDDGNRFRLGSWTASTKHSLGSSYTLVKGGQIVPITESTRFTLIPDARTVIGWNDIGHKWFVVVDQGPHSRGMNLAEAARFMHGLGATYAVNLDGGRSSALVQSGQVVNRPKEGERRVANMWMVVPAQPLGLPPPLGPLLNNLLGSTQ